MTFAVVIPSHSRPDLLRLCLSSVLNHAPPDTDIVVVDDGSKNRCVSAAAGEFPGVRAVRHASARGFAAAVNAGIANVSADVVELLNDDAEVTAGWADAVRHFADPGVVAVAPLVLMHGSDPARIDSAGDEYDRGGFARKRWHGERVAPRHLTPGPVWGVSAAAAFYRRAAVLAAGGFPEKFGAYFEDVDLSHRLAPLGRTHFDPGSVVRHRVSSSYGRRPGRRTLELQSRNEELVFWRNTPAAGRHLPRHLAVLAGKACRRLEDGTLAPWLTGRVRAAVGL